MNIKVREVYKITKNAFMQSTPFPLLFRYVHLHQTKDYASCGFMFNPYTVVDRTPLLARYVYCINEQKCSANNNRKLKNCFYLVLINPKVKILLLVRNKALSTYKF